MKTWISAAPAVKGLKDWSLTGGIEFRRQIYRRQIPRTDNVYIYNGHNIGTQVNQK